MYDPDRKTCIEVDVSGYTTSAVLSQEGKNSKWHPVAFHSESMSNAEHNYDIYNKKILTIICALQAWHHYLEDLSSVFKIQLDYKNLECWKTAQNLSCRQACLVLSSKFIKDYIDNCDTCHYGKTSHAQP